jgi:hypothetical protein
MPRGFAIRALLLGACVATCAWGGVRWHARTQAKAAELAFTQWRSDATLALAALTTPQTTPNSSRGAPSLARSQPTELLALAHRHSVALHAQGDVLRVPSNTFIEFEGKALLALVPGPLVEGEPTCMLLTDDARTSFVLLAMLEPAFARSVRWTREARPAP